MTLLNRWWKKEDYDARRKRRPHRDWPDIIDFIGLDYGATVAWLGGRCQRGRPEGLLQILEEGERFARELGDERSLAVFYSSMGMYYSLTGDPVQGTKYADDSFGEAEKIEDIELMAPIAFDLCASYMMAGEYLKAAEVILKVIALLEKTQRESESFGRGFNVYSVLLGYYGQVVGWLGNFKEGQALCEKVLRFAAGTNDLYGLASAEIMYGYVCAEKGDGNGLLPPQDAGGAGKSTAVTNGNV